MTEPVGIGIVGTGRWARAHATAASRSSRVRIVHCSSRTEDKRNEYGDGFGIPVRSASLAEMLDDPAVEAVIIATPNDLHVPMAVETLQAGKPMLIDKPVAVSVAQGLELLRAAGPGNPTIGVAHHPRKLAGQRFAKQWIDSGDAGKVRLGYATFSNARGGAMRPDAWHRSVEGSEGGVLIQVGIHSIDTLLWLLGPVTEVGARFAYGTMGPTMPDAVAVTMRHASGALSLVGSSWTTPSQYRLDLQATSGNLSYRLDHAAWTKPDVDDHARLWIERDGEADRPVTPRAGDPLQDQIEELAAAVRHGAPMTVSIEDGVASVAVVEAAVLSASEGRVIQMIELFGRADASAEEVGAVLGSAAPAAGQPEDATGACADSSRA